MMIVHYRQIMVQHEILKWSPTPWRNAYKSKCIYSNLMLHKFCRELDFESLFYSVYHHSTKTTPIWPWPDLNLTITYILAKISFIVISSRITFLWVWRKKEIWFILSILDWPSVTGNHFKMAFFKVPSMIASIL